MSEASIYAAEKLDAELFTGVPESRQALEDAAVLLEQKSGRGMSLNRVVSGHLLLTACNPHGEEGRWGGPGETFNRLKRN